MSSNKPTLDFLESLKQYHDILVKINNLTDLVKQYKVNFHEDSMLIEELIECFEKEDEWEGVLVSEVYVDNGNVKVRKNLIEPEENTSKEKESGVKNRKQKQDIKDEPEEKIVDITEENKCIADVLINKRPSVLNYSKNKKRRELISNIKEQYKELLTNDINKLLEVKKYILDQ